MKNIIILLTLFIFFGCKKDTVIVSKPNNTKKEVKITKEEEEKDCNSMAAGPAVVDYLKKTGVIEYDGQVSYTAPIRINSNCDFRVTVTFYLENLVSGDGSRDYFVSFDGKEYFVH